MFSPIANDFAKLLPTKRDPSRPGPWVKAMRCSSSFRILLFEGHRVPQEQYWIDGLARPVQERHHHIFDEFLDWQYNLTELYRHIGQRQQYRHKMIRCQVYKKK